jgi:hypothetical protein
MIHNWHIDVLRAALAECAADIYPAILGGTQDADLNDVAKARLAI